MGSSKRAVMGLESRAVSARVTKHSVTIFSKTCNNVTLNMPRALVLNGITLMRQFHGNECPHYMQKSKLGLIT